MIHTYLGKTISFDINYKNRTSIGINVDLYGKMEVQAPKGTSDEQVLSLLEGKWDWIQAKMQEIRDRSLGPQEEDL